MGKHKRKRDNTEHSLRKKIRKLEEKIKNRYPSSDSSNSSFIDETKG
jgi:hypothetical protein